MRISDWSSDVCSSDLRKHLLAIGDLPDTPLVVNSARSSRRDEHGPFGNRIVALHPHLATHLAAPIARLRPIQASMAAEMRRHGHAQALLDVADQHYDSCNRLPAFSDRMPVGKRQDTRNL